MATNAKEQAEKSAMLAALFDSAPIGIFCLDREARVILWGPAAERMFGWTAEEVLGQVNPIVPADKTSEFLRLYRRSLAGETIMMQEVRRQRKDGALIDISLSIAPLRDGDGQILGAIGMFVDIAARKQAEAALRASKEKYHTLYAQSPIALELYDAAGRLVDVNPACLTLFGVQRAQELEGFDLFNDPNLPDEYKTRLKAGETVRYTVAFDFEKVRRLNLYSTTKRGIIWLDVLITPLGDAPPPGYLVQVQDITERKQAEAALRASEARYRDMAENTNDWLWEQDAAGVFVYSNTRVLDILGYTPQEIIGRQVMELAPAEDLPAWQAMSHNTVAHPLPAQGIQVRLRHKSGRTVILESNFVPLYHPTGELAGFRGIDRDITERMLAEMQRQAYARQLETQRQALQQEVEKRQQAEATLLAQNAELQAALATIKTLSGLIPICAWCGRKIQTEEGHWVKVEHYIEHHSDAEFTHGICPECQARVFHKE